MAAQAEIQVDKCEESAFACFWQGEEGQDLTEYGLLLAFVVLAAVGIFLVNAQSLTAIWRSADTTLSRAQAVAAS